MKDESRITWGVSFLVFGLFFFLRQLDILPGTIAGFIFSLRNLLFIFGIIFLFTHKNKSYGIILIAVGVLFYLKDIIVWTESFSDFIWPALLIAAGVITLASSRSRRKKESSVDDTLPTDKESVSYDDLE